MLLIAALARRHDGNSWLLAFIFEWASRRRHERLVSIAAAAFQLAHEFRSAVFEWARAPERSADRETVMSLLGEADSEQKDDDGFTLRIPLEDGLHEFTVTPPEAR